MKNVFYVYEWIRLDTNEPFYVGKGKGNRWKELTRGNNQHFNNIVKSIPIVVNILHDNLDEQTAFGLEVWYIREYRDIIGYDLVNINDGGEGCVLCGKNSPWYGKHHSEEVKKKMRESSKKENLSQETLNKMSKCQLGKNNNVAMAVICVTTKRIFYTVKEASIFYNIDNSGIVKCCKGKLKTCGKLSNGTRLKWKYINWNHDKTFRISK